VPNKLTLNLKLVSNVQKVMFLVQLATIADDLNKMVQISFTVTVHPVNDE